MLEIHLFGELSVVRDGRAVELPASRKTRALLAYLAATPRPQLREKLCTLLWDRADDPRAALRWSLTKLRPILDDPPMFRLVADRDHAELDPVDAVVDLAALRAVIPGGTPGGASRASTEVLRSVAPLLRGELLEGLELLECPRFTGWCRAERDLARRLGAAVLGTLVERLAGTDEDGRYEAIEYAQTWLALDPSSEAARAASLQRPSSLWRT